MNNNNVRNGNSIGCFICLILLVLVGAVLCWIGHENTDEDSRYCAIMESKESFTDKEKEALYHWMHPGKYDDHTPSRQFIELYRKRF